LSTLPGPDSWRDAGVTPGDPEEPRRLGDDEPDQTPADPEEYAPGFPRADLEDRAAEADVVEQDIEVEVDDGDED